MKINNAFIGDSKRLHASQHGNTRSIMVGYIGLSIQAKTNTSPALVHTPIHTETTCHKNRKQQEAQVSKKSCIYPFVSNLVCEMYVMLSKYMKPI